jgi:hypothetical protein
VSRLSAAKSFMGRRDFPRRPKPPNLGFKKSFQFAHGRPNARRGDCAHAGSPTEVSLWLASSSSSHARAGCRPCRHRRRGGALVQRDSRDARPTT